MMDKIKLPDGRQLAYAEYGDPKGSPMLFCHGIPGSRLLVSEEMEQSLLSEKIRLIIPDRPGIGQSDPQHGREFIDWANDVAELMNAIGIDRFRVIGYSMGAPYALACASAMPIRVTGVTLVGGIAPNVFAPEVTAVLPAGSSAIFSMAKDNPENLHDALKSMIPDADALFAAFGGLISDTDKKLMSKSEIASAFKRDCVETMIQGHTASATDFILTAKYWGFDLEEIRVPVQIWNGLEDVNAPPAMAEYLARKLPVNTIRLLPGEAHLCLFTHWGEILAETGTV